MSIEKIICYTLFHSTSMALPQHFLITSLPLPQHFLCTSLSLPYHFLVTSLACPLLFFCTSLAHPRHLIDTSSHFLGTRRFLGTSCALPSHFLGTSSTLSQCFLSTSLEIPRHKKSRKKYLKKNNYHFGHKKVFLVFCIGASIHIGWESHLTFRIILMRVRFCHILNWKFQVFIHDTVLII